jgi:hypothetical protein
MSLHANRRSGVESIWRQESLRLSNAAVEFPTEWPTRRIAGAYAALATAPVIAADTQIRRLRTAVTIDAA